MISHLKRLQRLFLLTSGHTVSNEHEVFKALKELDQAKAWDVTGFTQSKNHSVTYLFNESFRTGQFPSVCKIAKVTQPFKGGSPIDCDNYGPFNSPVFPNSWSPLLTLTYEIWHTRGRSPH